MKNKLTYFTPTYNRSKLLYQLYESLKSQTNKNFVWCVIDDGSTDNTKQVVNDWIKEKAINIKYIYKENGGKHSAINLANEVCETEFICCCDSDDYLSKDATDVIYKYINLYINNTNVVGFVGRNTDYDGKLIDKGWTEKSEEICFYDLPPQDTILIFKTEIVKRYKFPIFENEKFVTESVFYQQFLYDYKMVTMMENIHLIEYQADGYSSQGMDLFFKNPKGFLYSLKANLFYSVKYKKGFKKILKNAIKYYAWKSVIRVDEETFDELNIKSPYNFLGKTLKFALLGKFKKQYKEFLRRKEETGKKNDKNSKC